MEEPPLLPRSSGSKSLALASGVQKTLSKASMLGNFLPTGTLLTFEMVLPYIYDKGGCSSVSTLMILFLLGLCTLSCFFFHFTDSFSEVGDDNLYYGFVTPNGLAVFKPGLRVVCTEEKYKICFTDFVHAMMSVLVFVAISISDHRVTDCLLPGHAKELNEVMPSFSLMVGIICSSLFLVFPITREGIGFMPSSRDT